MFTKASSEFVGGRLRVPPAQAEGVTCQHTVQPHRGTRCSHMTADLTLSARWERSARIKFSGPELEAIHPPVHMHSAGMAIAP